MNRILSKIEGLYGLIVAALFAMIVTFMLCYNISLDVILINWEHNTYIDNRFIINLILCIALMLLVSLVYSLSWMRRIRSLLSDDIRFNRVRIALLVVILIEALIWAACSQFIPGVDEGELHGYAAQVASGDFKAFAPGGYLTRYPSNWGMFLYDYYVGKLVGYGNYLVFEIINAFAICLMVKQLSDIGRLLGIGRIGQIGILLLGVVFLPISFYSIMVYGNMIGLSLSILAVKETILFCRKEHYRDAVIGALAIASALFFKNTMLIYVVAIIMVLCVLSISGLRVKLMAMVGLIVAFCFLQSTATRLVVQCLVGDVIDQPCSTLSWIAMGLQDSEIGPGWWNGYILDSYNASGFDSAKQAMLAKASIGQSFEKFTSNSTYALNFFIKKIVSTWNNPSFQCFGTVRRGSLILIPKWMNYMLTYNSQSHIMPFLDTLSSTVYLGALLHVCLGFRRSKKREVSHLLITVFIGGVIYLLLSETKSRYALMFWVVLIPLAIDGFVQVARFVNDIAKAAKRKSISYRLVTERLSTASICFMLLGAIAFCCSYQSVFKPIIGKETSRYETYLVKEDVSRPITKYIRESV